MIIIAIDPGMTGGVVRYDTDAPHRSCLKFYPVPIREDGVWDPWVVARAVFQWGLEGAELFIVEQCHAFPGPQAYASAKVMEGYGQLLGNLAGRFNRSQVVITPANVWKKEMKITVPIVKAARLATKAEKDTAYKARKLVAVCAAETHFPGYPFRTPRGRLMDGEAEAALLALWGSRMPKEAQYAIR